MPELVLKPAAPEWNGDVLRQSCDIIRTGSSSSSSVRLWWECPSSLPSMPEGDAESYLVAAVLVAMSEGRDIRVEGTVGRGLLSGIEEFMLAWRRWNPELYRVVRILPEEASSNEPSRTSGAITAFSGGVDAAFTVWRHHSRAAGHASRDIVAGAMVHGFDIPLDQEEKFAASFRLARATLDSLDIPLIALRTNIRQVFGIDWHDLHGAALVGVMQTLRSKAGSLLIGSSDPYDQLLLPYGSNPVTDHLLSTAGMDVVHDGCGFDRTQKVAFIAGWKTACDNLRVCWEGEQVGANCGHCEKCLRTRLNFLANGLAVPQNLQPPGEGFDFSVVDTESESVLQEFDQILQVAHRSEIRSPWVAQLERRMAWLRRRNLYRQARRSLRGLVRKFRLP